MKSDTARQTASRSNDNSLVRAIEDDLDNLLAAIGQVEQSLSSNRKSTVQSNAINDPANDYYDVALESDSTGEVTKK